MTPPNQVLYNPGMSEIEWRTITPEEMIRDIENVVQQHRESKYVFQVGIKDLDFDVNEDRRKAIGIHLPYHSLKLKHKRV